MPDNTNTLFFPPYVYAGSWVAGGVLTWLWPLPISKAYPWLWGVALVLLAFAIVTAAIRELAHHQTTHKVSEATRALVTSGIYRHSRNPIYLAGAILSLGFALMANSWWLVAALAVVLVLIQTGVIHREEAYLARAFGSSYRDYTARVRRWL